MRKILRLSYLYILIVTGVDGGELQTSHKAVGDGIVYDEAWDEKAELLVSNEVKEREVEKSEILGMGISSNEVRGGKAGRVK